MIFDDEIPRPPKAQPRYLPAAVLDQLNSHLGSLKAPWMQMVLILQECGMRISELLQLPLDCLTQDARGTFYLRFMQGKMKREHTIPVSQEIARLIQEQQQVVRATGRSTALLFPNAKGGVSKQQSFAQRINRLAYDHQVRDAKGKLFRFQSHQFRHTVGTRMINLGVPHHFIQRYLGHLGPEMTNRYAHIHDSTMREKLSEYLQGTLVDVTGKAVPEGPLDTSDLRWFTRNVMAQALPNGYCAIPVVAGPCPHPNACLSCAHFRTDASFLDVHKAELRDTERVITKANANGWTRQIEMNERKRNNLVNIVTSLERERTMTRNTEGLKKSARLRSESAMQRALVALQRMEASDREINFRTVAAEAGVSTAWLYSQEELRVRIMRSRTTAGRAVPGTDSPPDRQRLSKQNIVATLRLRIKTLEEKNRELTGLLELAYGQLTVATTASSRHVVYM